VLAELEQDCRRSGQETHWLLFWDLVVAPIHGNSKSPSLRDLCLRHRVDSEVKASNMVITAKRKFRSILERRIRASVDRSSDVQDEIRDLVKILSGGGAGQA
jgi:hypothetical protein